MPERISQLILSLALLLAADRAAPQEDVCEGTARAIDISSIDAIDAEVVFFGELHGNKETPEVFLAAICQYLEQRDGDVRVALEFGTDIHLSLDRVMESDGGSESVQEFLRNPFWQQGLNLPDGQRGHGLPDGRSSVAMLNLVEALRELRATTTRLVTVSPIVGRWTDRQVPYFGKSANAILAANITHLSQESADDVVFVLVGDVHARLTSPESMSHLTPAASLVEGDVVSVLILPESGESWNCQGACQSWPVWEITDVTAYESQVRTEGSYDHVLPIDRVSSSPPAVGVVSEAP